MKYNKPTYCLVLVQVYGVAVWHRHKAAPPLPVLLQVLEQIPWENRPTRQRILGKTVQTVGQEQQQLEQQQLEPHSCQENNVSSGWSPFYSHRWISSGVNLLTSDISACWVYDAELLSCTPMCPWVHMGSYFLRNMILNQTWMIWWIEQQRVSIHRPTGQLLDKDGVKLTWCSFILGFLSVFTLKITRIYLQSGRSCMSSCWNFVPSRSEVRK